MRGGWTALLAALVGCYQPEFEKDSGVSGLDTADSGPDGLPETTSACITAFPVTGTDDLHSDAPRVGALDTTVDDVLGDCDLAGAACDADAWIGHDAATCIGPHVGVDSGVDGQVYAALRFDAPLGLVVWAVENDLGENDDTGDVRGMGVLLDAETGAVVSGPYEWRLSGGLPGR